MSFYEEEDKEENKKYWERREEEEKQTTARPLGGRHNRPSRGKEAKMKLKFNTKSLRYHLRHNNLVKNIAKLVKKEHFNSSISKVPLRFVEKNIKSMLDIKHVRAEFDTKSSKWNNPYYLQTKFYSVDLSSHMTEEALKTRRSWLIESGPIYLMLKKEYVRDAILTLIDKDYDSFNWGFHTRHENTIKPAKRYDR